MEGKAGLNMVLTVIGLLLAVAGVALCILFGVNVSLVETVSVVTELFVGIACIGVGLILLVLCNIAVNARVTADNTYDILRHVETLCQKEGISFADLARKDAKIAEKKVVLEAKAKLKKEKEARIKAEAATAEANELLRVQKESNAQAQLAINEMQSKMDTVPEVAAPEDILADTPEEEAAPAMELNCGISADDWKANLAGKGTCGTCGAPISARTNKGGRVGLVCKNNGSSACSEKPMFIEDFAVKFIEWYNGVYPGKLSAFDMTAFLDSVASFSIKDGSVLFVGK